MGAVHGVWFSEAVGVDPQIISALPPTLIIVAGILAATAEQVNKSVNEANKVGMAAGQQHTKLILIKVSHDNGSALVHNAQL